MPGLNKIIACFTGGALLITPFFFGGTAAPFRGLLQISAFILTLAALLTRREKFAAFFRAPAFCAVFAGILTAVTAAGISLLVIVNQGGGRAPPLPGPSPVNLHDALASLGEIVFFLCFYFLCCLAIKTGDRSQKTVSLPLVSATLAVALTALLHWFYDNGRLFWIFAPSNVFTSPRARWPFVNPNHLGYFLLPGFFLLASRFDSYRSRLREKAGSMGNAKRRFLTSAGVQSILTRMAFIAAALAVLLTVLAGTLSRGAWLAFFTALLACLLSGRLSAPSPSDAPPGGAAEATGRKRGLKKYLPSPRAVFSPLIPAIPVIALFAVLGGKGLELAGERIEWGMAASLDDMRWTMYRGTAAMIADHPVIGVGAGNWDEHYWRYIDPSLAGMTPEYLHSDPLQFVAETGLAGSLPIAAGALWLAVLWIKALKGERRGSRRQRSLVYSGAAVFAILTGSFFDFPLRVPAVSLCLAACLALLTSAISAEKS